MDGQVLDEQPDRLTDITILQLLCEQDKNGQKHTNQLPTCRQWEGDWRSWNPSVFSADREQNNQLLILDGKTNIFTLLPNSHTCGKLPFSHA